MSYTYLFKFIIIGDSGSGKTSLLKQFIDKKFNYEHDITIGVEFGTKKIHVDDQTVKIHVWDTAGTEAFRSITRSYYRNCTTALLVYDINSRNTFVNLIKWVEEIRKYCNSNITIVLIGNKTDIKRRQVSSQEGMMFAKKHGFLFFETSSKNGENVNECFTYASKTVINKINHGDIYIDDTSLGIKLGTEIIFNVYNEEDTTDKKDKRCYCI